MIPGSLQNNRLFMANTEELHDYIEQLSARNRDLEDALRTLQALVSPQTHHPLLEAGPSQQTLPIHSSVTPLSDYVPGTSSDGAPPNILDQEEVRKVDAFGDFSALFY